MASLAISLISESVMFGDRSWKMSSDLHDCLEEAANTAVHVRYKHAIQVRSLKGV